MVDVLKAVAAQLIVLHHFSAYGPVSNVVHRSLPVINAWFYGHARMAVQVFLVVGGYLAARSLSGTATPQISPWAAIAQRFMRLLGPYLVALTLAVTCAALARPWLADDFIPKSPTWTQWFAHLGLLHGVLGFESLSAGVWYVAIDFQLFAMLTLLAWVGRGPSTATRVMVAGACMASLALFNRNAGLDNWAPYFFGAYGLGALAWWAGRSEIGKTSTPSRLLFVVTLALGMATLMLDLRSRIVVAMGVALALVAWGQTMGLRPARLSQWVQGLSQTSYALFLVHFPVLMLVNAAFTAFSSPGEAKFRGLSGSLGGLVFTLAGWALSVWAAHLFYHRVEAPLARVPWGLVARRIAAKCFKPRAANHLVLTSPISLSLSSHRAVSHLWKALRKPESLA